MCIPDLIYKPTVEPGNRIMILENWDGMMKRGFTPEYCEENEIRFIVVLSEHLTFDFLDNEKKYIKTKKTLLNNVVKSLFTNTEEEDKKRYVSFNNFTKTSSNISHEFNLRTKLLKRFDKFVDFYCTIGRLPRLEPWAEFFNRPQSDFVRFPINTDGLKKITKFKRNPKIVFTGQLTNYRAILISDLIKNGLDVEVYPLKSFDFDEDSSFFIESLNDEMKNEFYRKFDYVLDIPKDKDWPYSSTIRILDSLRMNSKVIVGDTYVDEDIRPYTITISEFLSNIHK